MLLLFTDNYIFFSIVFNSFKLITDTYKTNIECYLSSREATCKATNNNNHNKKNISAHVSGSHIFINFKQNNSEKFVLKKLFSSYKKSNFPLC